MLLMQMKEVTFVKAVEISGYELACSRCPIVLQITHNVLEPMPKHRCHEKARDFDIVLKLDNLVLYPSRIDDHWLKSDQ
jgi:hypothetical protein